MTVYAVDKLISEARRLAAEYRKATGQSLGVSAEIARHDVARLLGLELVPATAPGGYDALGKGRWEGKRIQIKGRAVFDESKSGQRIGQLKLGQDWDLVMLILMDENFEPFEIHEADRSELEAAVEESSSKRNKRGALSVARFKIIGRLVWTRENGLEDDGFWDNTASL
ncbi:MAG: hypothetical protein QNK18_06315 [Gammaproteobacteria bacterium]|nr:hypothetical protein [Gammaproteobacteria bacterium]MDJ0890793.1 hypothetical protein [Gammaproteobacteria bacterium]